MEKTDRRIIIYIGLILLLLVSTMGFSQSSENYWIKAGEFYKNGKYDSARYFYQRVTKTNAQIDWDMIQFRIAEMYLEAGSIDIALVKIDSLIGTTSNELWLGKLTTLKARGFFSSGQPQRAVDLMDSLKLKVTSAALMAELLNIRAKSLIWTGDLKAGESSNNLADSVLATLSEKNPLLSGNIRNVAGILYYFQGKYDSAILEFEKAIVFRKEVLDEFHPEVIALYSNTGVMYKNKNQLDKALEYYGYELENLIRSVGQNHLSVSVSYQNIGSLLHQQGKYDLAIKAFEKSLDLKTRILGNSNPQTLDIIEWLGNVNAAMGNYVLAEEQFRQVLERRIQSLGESNHFVSLAYYNIGESLYKQEKFEASASYFKQAIKIGLKIYKNKNQDQATCYNGLGMCLLKVNDLSGARNNFFRALEESVPGFRWSGDEQEVPLIGGYLRFRELFDSMIGLAGSYCTKQASMNDLNVAIRYLEEAERLLKELKNSFSSDADRIEIASYSKVLVDLSLDIQSRLFAMTNEETTKRQIFKWSEYSKSLALLTSIEDAQARRISNIPDSLLRLENRYRLMKDSISNELLEVSRTGGQSKIAILNTALFKIGQEHLQLIEYLENNYQNYAERKYGIKTADISEVQKKLKEAKSGSSLLLYHYSRTGDLFINYVDSANFECFKINDPELDNKVINFRVAISEQNEEAFELWSKKIYQSVIQPIKSLLTLSGELVVIPDGVLAFVPFEILLNGKGHYLLEEYNIYYDFSATFYSRREAEKLRSKKSLLAFAPDFSDDAMPAQTIGNLTLRDANALTLPGAYDESVRIAKDMNGQLRSGHEATESLFKVEASDYNIIHIATHSIVNDQNSDFSKLLFEKSDQDDGNLHAFELRNLNLNAQLVTLSACNTGVGQIKKGEGVMSLSRAFAYAGVPATVVSLWPASDKSTPELMKYFYQNLKDGQRKSEALNNARKQYLATATGKARHPFYWGGFVVIGDDSPITNENSYVAMILSLLFLLTAVPIVLVIKNKYLSID